MVSVIVTTYRRLEFLKLTVSSILNQTYSDFEIIIVADGHQPDIEDYVYSTGNSKISYYFVEHFGYPAKARNFGIDKANGEYIAFCDDDDLWEKEKLKMQLVVMQNNLQIVLCCTNRYIIDEKGKKIKEQALRKPKLPGILSLLVSNYVTTSSVVIRRSILEKTGLFPDTFVFKVGSYQTAWTWLHKLRVAMVRPGRDKRWIMGTLQRSLSKQHMEYYLDKYTFRFNRRKSGNRGMLFYRLVEQAARIDTVTYGDIIGREVF
jgi:glycosyltransferase involved in cell wall biosynthesis